MVMLCLLDGLSRKQIASHLGITLHTVNDHMKTLFAQFDVNSTTELAAKFLKAR
jgi:DNA-binding CsgD family transcriptional regulator